MHNFLRIIAIKSFKYDLFLRSVSISLRDRHVSRFSTSSLPFTVLSDEEQAMKDIARKLSLEKIEPLVKRWDVDLIMDKTVIKALFDNALMGIDIDPKYGGTGSTFFTAMLVIEELAKVDASVSELCAVQNTLVSQVFHRYANQDLKTRYFPRISKDSVGSFCLLEPSSGSNVFALKTCAVEDGNDYVINGEKRWSPNAEHAGFFLVFANVNPSVGYKGITCFVADRDTPGITVQKREEWQILASITCPVYFDGVRLPKSNIIGSVGHGYEYAIEVLNDRTITTAAQMLGLADGCFQHAMKYFQSPQFNQKDFDSQLMQQEISSIATEISAARLLVYNAARIREANKPFIKEAAMAKYYATEVAERITTKSMEWFDCVGFVEEFPFGNYYYDCRNVDIYGEKSDTQLNTIAKHITDQFRY